MLSQTSLARAEEAARAERKIQKSQALDSIGWLVSAPIGWTQALLSSCLIGDDLLHQAAGQSGLIVLSVLVTTFFTVCSLRDGPYSIQG